CVGSWARALAETKTMAAPTRRLADQLVRIALLLKGVGAPKCSVAGRAAMGPMHDDRHGRRLQIRALTQAFVQHSHFSGPEVGVILNSTSHSRTTVRGLALYCVVALASVAGAQ